MNGLTAGKLAKKAGVNVETLRYYEKRGLLPEPPRTESGYRAYPPDQIQRLQFIKGAQSLGFTLNEIQALLELRVSATATRHQVRHRAENKVAQIDAKIEALQQMRQALTHLIEQCHGDGATSDCPILDGMAHNTFAPTPAEKIA
jgi:MerR family mercuric resistance operon transcriptional regulator